MTHGRGLYLHPQIPRHHLRARQMPTVADQQHLDKALLVNNALGLFEIAVGIG